MNLSEPFEDWYCCLNPRESTALSMLAVSWFANPDYITEEAYTVVAFISGLAGLTIVNQYFRDHYGLTEGFIPNGDDPPIAVLFFDLEFWANFYAFTQTAGYMCVKPCAAFEFWT